MSLIEEQLARDIKAVTGGVVVTESDLRDARDAVEERIDIRRQRDRRRTLAFIAAAAVVIPILGVVAVQVLDDEESAPPVSPAPTNQGQDYPLLTGDAPTSEAAQGVWRVDNGTTAMRFSAPDLVSFDDGGQLFHDPDLQGRYEIEGDLITITVDRGPTECAGRAFAIRASLPEPGLMRFVLVQRGSHDCTPVLGVQGVLERALPTWEGLASLGFSQKEAWKPPAVKTALYGDWLAVGGGHLLELAPDGAYYVAAESGDVVDRGQWSLQDSELTLTSSAGSADCSPGDRLVWSRLEQVDPGISSMRGTVEQNTCGGAWASKDWIVIPHKGS